MAVVIQRALRTDLLTLEEVKGELGIPEDDATRDVQLRRWITAATRVLEGLLKRDETPVPLARQLYRQQASDMVNLTLILDQRPVETFLVERPEGQDFHLEDPEAGILRTEGWRSQGTSFGFDSGFGFGSAQPLMLGGTHGLFQRAAVDPTRYSIVYYAGYLLACESWQPETNYTVGQWVRFTGEARYLCVEAGTSAATPPEWPLTTGTIYADLPVDQDPSKVEDGTVVWQAWPAQEIPPKYPDAARALIAWWDEKGGIESATQSVQKGGLRIQMQTGKQATVPGHVRLMLGLMSEAGP